MPSEITFLMKAKLKSVLIAFVGLLFLILSVWLFAGIRLGVWTTRDYERYVRLTTSIPAAHALWHDDIKAGDNAEQIVTSWHPHIIWRFGRWIDMRWYPGGPRKDVIPFVGIYVRAQDGVLVYASSYSDDGVMKRVFFDKTTPADNLAHERALKERADDVQAEQPK